MLRRVSSFVLVAALVTTPAYAADDAATTPAPAISVALFTAAAVSLGAAIGLEAAALDADRSAREASRYDRQERALERAQDRQEVAIGCGIGALALAGAGLLLWWLARDGAASDRQQAWKSSGFSF